MFLRASAAPRARGPGQLAREAQSQQSLGNGRHLRRVGGDLQVHHVLAIQARDRGTADMLGDRAQPGHGNQRCDLRSDYRGPAIGPMRAHALYARSSRS